MTALAEFTRLLEDLTVGNRAVADRLMPLVYDELRGIAHRQMQGERSDHTLDTTALVHEAYLNLVKNEHLDWQNRAHFLFGGLSHDEIAEGLGVSVPTVHRDWRLARLWLSREMKRDPVE